MKQNDHWIANWHSELRHKNVLELGCGEGRDTRHLQKLATSLVACDQHIDPARKTIETNESTRLLEMDHSYPLSFEDDEFDVVVASLSLHYFGRSTVKRIMAEIRRILIPKGVLICRVNSTNDVNYGSKGHQEIEPGLFVVNDMIKRFYDEAMIHDLFGKEWSLCHLSEKTIDRYANPKVIWELKAIAI